MGESRGCVVVAVPQDATSRDVAIMRHIGKEVNGLMTDGMEDLIAYGDYDDWTVAVTIKFDRKEVEENGR